MIVTVFTTESAEFAEKKFINLISERSAASVVNQYLAPLF
jgi:hypothetical protein